MRKAACGVLGHASLRPADGYSGTTCRVYPFAKSVCGGEQVKQSLVCTSSVGGFLRPCWTAFLNLRGIQVLAVLVGLLQQDAVTNLFAHAGAFGRGSREARHYSPLNATRRRKPDTPRSTYIKLTVLTV